MPLPLSLPKDVPMSQETDTPPLWWQHATEGMNAEDQLSIQRMRAFLGEKAKNQRWYYSGSGPDVSPTFIAPYTTEHWYVDPSYNESHRFYRETLGQEFSEPFQKLGGKVELARPWEEAWKTRRQTITVDGKTTLQLIGGLTQDKRTAPDRIDVIYTNPYSTSPGPDALIALKTGGYYVYANDRDEEPKFNFSDHSGRMEDLGFKKVDTFPLTNAHFPNVGELRTTTDGKPLFYQVYEKTRAFTPEEEDILQIDSSLWEIDYVLDEYVFRFDNGNFPPELAAVMDEDLSTAFTRYFDRITHSKGSSADTIQQAEARMNRYFPGQGIIPDIVTKNYLYQHRDPKIVQSWYQKAMAMYQEYKRKSEVPKAP